MQLNQYIQHIEQFKILYKSHEINEVDRGVPSLIDSIQEGQAIFVIFILQMKIIFHLKRYFLRIY